MAEAANTPWLTIVGWGESGTAGLTPASKQALAQADIVFGAARHLSLLPGLDADIREWPVPFAQGIPLLLAERGRAVVMLVSGDPFWFGAGTVLARHLYADEWRALPVASTFSLAAARLGWALERTQCLGLHAARLTRIRPHLQPGQRLLVLLRDGGAVAELVDLLAEYGFARSTVHILEALGGARERIRVVTSGATLPADIQHPVALGLEVAGDGPAIPLTPGVADDFFEHDGQITKQRVRSMTLSALAPCAGERLWDIGTGSGAVAIEWLLAHADNRAIGFERCGQRAARAKRNARAVGVDWLQVIEGTVPDALENQPLPHAVFIGGGLTCELLQALWQRLPEGVRIVANAVTLESEAVLAQWHAAKGGDLCRIEVAQAQPIGRARGWKARYPIVQWKVVR